jgi:hypothetical protein
MLEVSQAAIPAAVIPESQPPKLTIRLHTTLTTSLILDPLSLFVLFSLQDPQSSRSFTAGRFIYL